MAVLAVVAEPDEAGAALAAGGGVEAGLAADAGVDAAGGGVEAGLVAGAGVDAGAAVELAAGAAPETAAAVPESLFLPFLDDFLLEPDVVDAAA